MENFIPNLEFGDSEVRFLKFLPFLPYDLSAKHVMLLGQRSFCLVSSEDVTGTAETAGSLSLSFPFPPFLLSSLPPCSSMSLLRVASPHGFSSRKTRLLTQWHMASKIEGSNREKAEATNPLKD